MDENNTLYFRVKHVFKRVNVTLKSGTKTLYTKKLIRAVPGEMVEISVSKEMVEKSDGLEVNVSVETVI